MGKLTGWHTLNLDDVLPTLSTALRMYSTNRPALKMRSRRHNLPDRVTEWRIRCDGKPIGSVTLRKPTSGVIFGYAIAPGARGKFLELAKHEMEQVYSDIKNRIDLEHHVGVHWIERGRTIPKSIAKQKEWLQIAEIVEDNRDDWKEKYTDHLFENPRVTYKEMCAELVRWDIKCGRTRLALILKAYENGELDHIKTK